MTTTTSTTTTATAAAITTVIYIWRRSICARILIFEGMQIFHFIFWLYSSLTCAIKKKHKLVGFQFFCYVFFFMLSWQYDVRVWAIIVRIYVCVFFVQYVSKCVCKLFTVYFWSSVSNFMPFLFVVLCCPYYYYMSNFFFFSLWFSLFRRVLFVLFHYNSFK